MRKRISGVIGSFCEGGTPLMRLLPVSSDFNCQLLVSGLGRLNSLCNSAIILRYPGMEEGLRVPARYAAFDICVRFVLGRVHIPYVHRTAGSYYGVCDKLS